MFPAPPGFAGAGFSSATAANPSEGNFPVWIITSLAAVTRFKCFLACWTGAPFPAVLIVQPFAASRAAFPLGHAAGTIAFSRASSAASVSALSFFRIAHCFRKGPL